MGEGEKWAYLYQATFVPSRLYMLKERMDQIFIRETEADVKKPKQIMILVKISLPCQEFEIKEEVDFSERKFCRKL